MEIGNSSYLRQFERLCSHSRSFHLNLLLFGGTQTQCPLMWFRNDVKASLKLDLAEFYETFKSTEITSKMCMKIVDKRGMNYVTFTWLLYAYMLECLLRLSKSFNCSLRRYATRRNVDKVYQMLCHTKKKLPEMTPNMFIKLTSKYLGYRYVLPLMSNVDVKGLSLSIKHYESCYTSNTFSVKRRQRYLKTHCVEMKSNFLTAMIRAYVDTFCNNALRYLLPVLNEMQRSDIVQYAIARSLRNGLLSCVIDIPVRCAEKMKCTDHCKFVTVVVCKTCGYCLNLGKVKLYTSYVFPLNSLFYYRDQQEKNLHYSSRYDQPHCSLCGAMLLKRIPLYWTKKIGSVRVVFWRAVIGTNSACSVLNDKTLDVLTLCSNAACYNTTVIKNIPGVGLLNLLSHKNTFHCEECKVCPKATCRSCETCNNKRCYVCTESRKR